MSCHVSNICHNFWRGVLTAKQYRGWVVHGRHGFATVSRRHMPRLAIIGSGPAGFYAARRLMQKNNDLKIDMYERLPVPFGLVRYGVAPDHPEVKNCQDTFDEVAQSDRFTFIGNVAVGEGIPLQLIKQHYDGLLFAYGASQDRLLGIPGEELSGVHSARAFVGWYNGLPEFSRLRPDLDTDQAVVIGNGNVALDVARILLAPLDALKKTDISEHALDTLSRSRIERVTVAGRRGPMQAAFTIKELRELLTLPDVGFQFENPDLVPTSEYITKLPRLEQRKYRFSQLLAKGSQTPLDAAKKSWSLLSLVSPSEFIPDPCHERLSSVAFEENEFESPDDKFSKSARTVGVKKSITIPTQLAFRSIGYKSTAIKGLDQIAVGFNGSKGIIYNDGLGRALSGPSSEATPGVYCTGWVKNGPTGVIASTMEDAFATADAILEDLETHKTLQGSSENGNEGWDAIKRDPQVEISKPISWQDWQRIDAEEKRIGSERGKEREKFTSVRDMLGVIYPDSTSS